MPMAQPVARGVSHQNKAFCGGLAYHGEVCQMNVVSVKNEFHKGIIIGQEGTDGAGVFAL